MTSNKYHTVEIVPKYNRTFDETGNIDTPNTQMNARALSWPRFKIL